VETSLARRGADQGVQVKAPTTKPATAGYSSTPLARKLGFTEGTRLLARQAPDHYREWLEPLPDKVIFARRLSAAIDVIHLFVTQKSTLQRELSALRESIRPDTAVWVSWPKKTAKLPTDITEHTIREVALPLGFVDVKVCAVTEAWSGLKLVIRKALRG
jgi:hypothetical protein